jgi:2-methylisocitrate lyase-like PEP mutase family enzyme
MLGRWARISAAKKAADDCGVPFVINARSDGFFGGASDAVFDETVRRCNAYLQEGAGCVFVPFVRDRGTMEKLLAAIDGPVNFLANPAAPDLGQMQAMGVARVSIGGLFSLMIYTRVREACHELRDSGTLNWGKDNIIHPEMNKLMG